jgi:hypothetical protein
MLWTLFLTGLNSEPGGRCFDHNFLQFLPIFGEKNGVFLKNQCYDQIFENWALFWVKNANFFAKFFGENISKIITSVPGDFVFHLFSYNSSLKTRHVGCPEGLASAPGLFWLSFIFIKNTIQVYKPLCA